MQETFGQRFQRLRKAAGLTQEDVASQLNITAQAVSKWENDVSAPDISLLVELSEMLKVSLDELMGKTPETKFIPTDERKDLDGMILRVKVFTNDGDKVNLNLPLGIVRALNLNNIPLQINGNGKDVLSAVDINQILQLIEQGVVGKLVEVQTADGDNVEIWVE